MLFFYGASSERGAVDNLKGLEEELQVGEGGRVRVMVKEEEREAWVVEGKSFPEEHFGRWKGDNFSLG